MARTTDGDWIALSTDSLPVLEALRWAARPDCGAVVTFCGVVRDHAEGRPGVVSLEYEAYTEYVEPRLGQVAAGARSRWPALGRLALLHRVGRLAVGDTALVVVASTPHRAEAFEAASWCVDQVKATVPIWKLETWADGRSSWVACHALEAASGPGSVAPGSP